MKIQHFLVFLYSMSAMPIMVFSQHTFSIVAVDTITKEVGSIGATCLSVDREGFEALIISELIPGRGAIHTQSYWNGTNQYNAYSQLSSGASPSDVIDWLTTHDVESNPGIRQYGIAAIDNKGQASAAGFTGNNCLNFKKHAVGPYYSIQGNILLGEYVIDSMESRFTKAQGSLADRLMEGLKGALIAGADSRCLSEGLSSRSSFLRVAKADDIDGLYKLDIHVPSIVDGRDPIDSLESLYKEWKILNTDHIQKTHSVALTLFYDAQENTITLQGDHELLLRIKHVELMPIGTHTSETLSAINEIKYKTPKNIPAGIYICIFRNAYSEILVSKKILIP